MQIIKFPTNKFPVLQDLFKDIRRFSLERQVPIEIKNLDIKGEISKGMNDKKKQQMSYLVPFLGKLALDNKVETIIDVGSGQGYLDRMLATYY